MTQTQPSSPKNLKKKHGCSKHYVSMRGKVPIITVVIDVGLFTLLESWLTLVNNISGFTHIGITDIKGKITGLGVEMLVCEINKSNLEKISLLIMLVNKVLPFFSTHTNLNKIY